MFPLPLSRASPTTDVSKNTVYPQWQEQEAKPEPEPKPQGIPFKQPGNRGHNHHHHPAISMPMPHFHHYISSSAPSQLDGHVFARTRERDTLRPEPLDHAASWRMPMAVPAPPPVPTMDIATYDVQQLLQMLAALLQKIVAANDSLHEGVEQHPGHGQGHGNNELPSDGMLNPQFRANVLAFHGRNVPAISLHAYLTRILKYCPVTNDVFLSLLVYFDRIAKRANGSAIKDQRAPTLATSTKQAFVMDSYNIHRLIISGITVASKFFSDVFYKNSRYAKVGGLPLEELNHLEIQFLLLLNWELMISTEELERYADLLCKFWEREGNVGAGVAIGNEASGVPFQRHGDGGSNE